MPLEFNVRVIQSSLGVMATKIELNGPINAQTIEEFRQVMEKLLEKGAHGIILDCTRLEYVNSTGLAALLNYSDQAREAGGDIVFTQVPKKVMHVFEMMGFVSELSLLADDAAALVWLGSAAMRQASSGAEAAPAESPKPPAASAAPPVPPPSPAVSPVPPPPVSPAPSPSASAPPPPPPPPPAPPPPAPSPPSPSPPSPSPAAPAPIAPSLFAPPTVTPPDAPPSTPSPSPVEAAAEAPRAEAPPPPPPPPAPPPPPPPPAAAGFTLRIVWLRCVRAQSRKGDLLYITLNGKPVWSSGEKRMHPEPNEQQFSEIDFFSGMLTSHAGAITTRVADRPSKLRASVTHRYSPAESVVLEVWKKGGWFSGWLLGRDKQLGRLAFSEQDKKAGEQTVELERAKARYMLRYEVS